MPDLVDRDEWERQFARRLTRVEREQLAELMRQLGDPPNLSAIPESYWMGMSNSLGAEIVPMLTDVYLQAAQALLDETPIGVEWDLIHTAGSTWARQYGSELVQGLTNTTREFLRQSIGRFFTDQMTMRQLRDLLEQRFGPVRAELIASTEVTRAAVQGEMGIVDAIGEQGIRMVAVWNTSNDEIVCVVCEPLNQAPEDEPGSRTWTHPENGQIYEPPPAHPRCRCWLTHEFSEA
jgi:hypothetical protein